MAGDEITDAFVDTVWRSLTGAHPVGASDGGTYVVSAPTRGEVRRTLEQIVVPMIARAAYKRGQVDMRERAAAIVDGSVRQECCGFGQGSPPECCGCPIIEFDDPVNTAAAIRSLPTGGENG